MTTSSVAVASPTGRNARWLVVALLTVGVVIAYTDRINLSAALPQIRMSFPISAEASGILLSAFFWAYTLLQTPAGWLVDRFGLKWPYAAGLFLWSAVSAATALVSSLNGLIAMRIVLGIGESIVTPASMRYLREKLRRARERSAHRHLFFRNQVRSGNRGADCYLSRPRLRMEMDVRSERSALRSLAGSLASVCQG
jgi:MFS family permease